MSEKTGESLTIEEKVFRRKRFVPDKLPEYGFTGRDGGYFLSSDLLDGDFTAEIRIGRDGILRAAVTDNMNEEEYAQLRNPNFTGAYVNTVRDAYEKLLGDIASKCCADVAFAADQSNRIAELILKEFGTEPDYPWEEDGPDADGAGYGVFRHSDSGKWFALIMDVSRGKIDRNKDKRYVDIINLKAEESLVAELIKGAGIYPAWHMSHRTWISVTLDDTLTDERIMELVRESFRLTDKKAGAMDEALIRRVLSVADSVPAGKVVSYGQIAAMVGRSKNARLIGRIMSMADRYGEHPCHRVVNSAGRTVPGWSEQRGLLEAEGVGFLKNGCVDMKNYRWDGGK